MIKKLKEKWKDLWKVNIPEEIEYPLIYSGMQAYGSRESQIRHLKETMFSAMNSGWQRGGQKMIYVIEGILDILEEDIQDGKSSDDSIKNG